jgi:hypothetical protein
MAKFECHVCKRTPNDTALIRINEKGVPGIWACPDHTDIPMGHVCQIIHDDMERRRFTKK